MNDKILTLLGFAAKAGKLSYGFDAVKTALTKNKSTLVLTACDVSQKSQKEVLFFCDKYNSKSIFLSDYNMETLSRAVGRKCGILSVNDSSFSEGITKAVSNLSREETK